MKQFIVLAVICLFGSALSQCSGYDNCHDCGLDSSCEWCVILDGTNTCVDAGDDALCTTTYPVCPDADASCPELEHCITDSSIGETRLEFYGGLTTEVDMGPVPDFESFITTSGFTCGWEEDIRPECFFDSINTNGELRTHQATYSLNHLVDNCCFTLSEETVNDDVHFSFAGTILSVFEVNCTHEVEGVEQRIPQKRFSQPVTVLIPKTIQVIADFLAEADLHDIEVTRNFEVSLSLYEDEWETLIENTPILNDTQIYGSVRLEELLVEDEGYAYLNCTHIYECSTVSVFDPPTIADTGCSASIAGKILDEQWCEIIQDEVAIPSNENGCSREVRPTVIGGVAQHHFNFTTTAVVFPETTAPVLYIHAICNVEFPDTPNHHRQLLAQDMSMPHNMLTSVIIDTPMLRALDGRPAPKQTLMKHETVVAQTTQSLPAGGIDFGYIMFGGGLLFMVAAAMMAYRNKKNMRESLVQFI